MAPPLQPFPVSELELRVHSYSKDFKEKSRKLPRDFDMKRDCELFELVQYSCTTIDQMYEKKRNDPTALAQMECFPFVRLFRRYLTCGCERKYELIAIQVWARRQNVSRRDNGVGRRTRMEAAGQARIERFKI